MIHHDRDDRGQHCFVPVFVHCPLPDPHHVAQQEVVEVAVLYALPVETLLYRKLDWVRLKTVAIEIVSLMGVVFPILALAVSPSQFLAFEGIPQLLVKDITEWANTRTSLLMLVIVVLLITGCVMDMIPAILLLAPLLTPAAVAMGIDPIHFGIIMVVSLELGYLTPPMGLNLFVASSAFNENVSTVVRASFPFVCVMFAALVLIAFVPQISMVLLTG